MLAIERAFVYNIRTPPVQIVPFGDWHFGNKCCSIKGLKKVVTAIADTGALWLGMGDYADSIVLHDGRFRIGAMEDRLAAQEDYMDEILNDTLKMLQPIATPQQCLGILIGNHEDDFLRLAHSNVAKRLAKHINTPYLGYEAYITLKFSHTGGGHRQSIRIYASHGHGAGRKPGAKINRLADTFANYPADFVFLAHTHEMLAQASPYILPNEANRIVCQHRVGLISGSYLLKHTNDDTPTYVEKKGLPPVAIGMNWVSYNPNNGRKAWHGWVDDD